MIETNQIHFDKNNLADFYPAVRHRVDEYFSKKGISKHYNFRMVLKTIFILTVFVSTYILIMTNKFSGPVSLLLAMVNGFFTALIGLNISHDAIHGAYTSNPKANKWLGLGFNIVGANDYLWRIKHNIIHHTYTNIPDHDDDLNQPKIIRMSPNQEKWWVHRFQHFYIFILYTLSSITWVFIKDYKSFFQKKFSITNINNHPKKEYYRLFAYKLFYYTMFIVLPLVVLDFTWYQVLLGFVALHIVEGFTLAIIFQLAHVVEGVEFPIPDEKGLISKSWAAHQMYTTANFSRESKLANFICGGLNFQIEHHLFPKICHIHYEPISHIVKKTAEDFRLPYVENQNFIGAVRSHCRVMRNYGRV